MMQKTLSEVLEENADKNVKIGFVNGSNFYYCGPVSECDLEVLNAEARQWVKDTTHQSGLNLSSTMKSLTRCTEDFNKLVRSEYNKRIPRLSSKYIDGYLKSVTECTNTLRSQLKRAVTMEEYERAYKAVAGRKVHDVYKSQLKENEIIVIVEGCEVGPYWDDDEYKKGHT